MEHIVFEHPFWLFLPLLFLICAKFCKPRSEALFFPGTTMLQKAVKKSRLGVNVIKFLIVTLFSTALASPVIENEVSVQNDKGYEISLIMDASGSMEENNKFGIVKNIVEDFLDKRKHDKIGLTIFADFAYVAVPLTYDKKSIKRLLKRLDVGVAGKQRTALYEALFLSSNLFKDSKSKNKIAILLTDGMDNTNTIPLDVAIKTIKKYGIKVYTIGIGNPGDFNAQVLQYIAQESGGKFFMANSVQKLKAIYDTIDRLEKSEIKANKYVKKSYYFQYPLAIGVLLLVGLFFYRNRGGKA
jgi:Ca-activated chloride channel family protein